MRSTPIDLQPALYGKGLCLRPLAVGDHEALYQVASDPLIWEQHPSPLRYKREVFDAQIFSTGIVSQSTLVVIDQDSLQIIGSSRYYDVNEIDQEIAIGFTFLARSHWGGTANQEMKSLMLAHAFTWARRVWFHVGCHNMRSRKALEKIGAKLSHIESRQVNSEPVDHCFYFINR
jgi:RimJ/RimL family protein N-acetyltransferase